MADADQEQARRVIEAAMRETGLNLTQLAEVAGIRAHTTLTRFMNNPNVKHVPSTRTMNKIALAVTRIRLASPPVPPLLPTPQVGLAPPSPRPAPKRGQK